MGSGILPRDENWVTAIGAVNHDAPPEVLPAHIDPATDRLLVQATVGGQVSVVIEGGTLIIEGGSTATVTSINDSITPATFAVDDGSRIELIVENDSTVALYLLFGSNGTVSATNKSFTIQPQGRMSTSFQGEVNGVWASNASGAAKVTSVTT